MASTNRTQPDPTHAPELRSVLEIDPNRPKDQSAMYWPAALPDRSEIAVGIGLEVKPRARMIGDPADLPPAADWAKIDCSAAAARVTQAQSGPVAAVQQHCCGLQFVFITGLTQ
jgi:hypothetical protein